MVGGSTSGPFDECGGTLELQNEGGDTMNVKDTEPSVGDAAQLGTDRKPSLDTVSELAQYNGPDQSSMEKKPDKQNCVFKRGAKCVLQGMVGTKYVEKS